VEHFLMYIDGDDKALITWRNTTKNIIAKQPVDEGKKLKK